MVERNFNDLRSPLKQILIILFIISLLIFALLIGELVIAPDLIIDDQQGSMRIHIQAVSQFVFLPHNQTTIYWKVENADSIKLRGLDADMAGRIGIANMGDYVFDVVGSDGNEYQYTVHIFSWVLSPLRFSLSVIAILLFSTSGYALGYIQKILRVYNKYIQTKDYVQTPTDVWSDIKCNRYNFLILIVLSIVVHFVLWLGWPLHYGADAKSYVLPYLMAFKGYENTYYSMIYVRPPLPIILHGLTLDIGAWLNIVVQTTMAISCVIMIYLVLIPWGRIVSWLGSIIFLLYVPIQLLFHQISSEGVFTWAMILLLVTFRYIIIRTKPHSWLLLGITIGIVYQARPSGIVCLILLTASLFQNVGLLTRFRNIILGFLGFVIIITPWVIYRGIKFESFALVRTQGTFLFTSAYNFNLIQAGNGPYTERLIDLINEHVLSSQNYRDEQLNLDHILSPDSYNLSLKWTLYNDLSYIIDMYVGWEESHSFMNKVGLEAILSHPMEYYLQSVASAELMLNTKATLWTASPIDLSQRSLPLKWFYLAHPDYVAPPTDESLRKIELELSELFAPLINNVSPDEAIVARITHYWKNYFPMPSLFYFFAFIALMRSRNFTLLFLLYMVAIGLSIVIPSVILAFQERYRLVVDSVPIIMFSIGFNEVIRFFTTLGQSIQKHFTKFHK